jgi:cytochrome oxidase Cu insertion factor (SCO1/SenC/PrrC family)
VAASAGAAALLVFVPAALTGCSSSHHTRGTSASGGSSPFLGAALPAGVVARDFTLTDQAGRRVSLASDRGAVTILTFLYSTCGGECAVIAQQIRGALDQLPAGVRALLVSADPAVDTRAHVASFLAATSLAGRVRYLVGPERALRPLWRAYYVPPASSQSPRFARTTPIVLIDRAGRERVLFQLEQLTPESLAHDVRVLLREKT